VCLKQDLILQSNTFVLGVALILQQLSVKTIGCYSRTNIKIIFHIPNKSQQSNKFISTSPPLNVLD